MDERMQLDADPKLSPEREAKFEAHMSRLQIEADLRMQLEAMVAIVNAYAVTGALKPTQAKEPPPLLTAISAIHDSRRARPNEWPA